MALNLGVPQEGPKFYGRRRGKTLRPTAKGLLEELLPQMQVPEPAPGTVLEPRSLFSAPVRAVWLEVGFGGGEHAAWQAEHHPDIGLIASEVFVNGVASLMGHVATRGLAEQGNLRIFAEDVRRLMPALPDACLERAFVLFPDPWPKKRHAERRFIGKPNLDQLARLLVDGGELRVASDDPTYIEWATEQLTAHPLFEPAEGEPRGADWPPTRYEAKALAAGRKPTFFRMRRVPRVSV